MPNRRGAISGAAGGLADALQILAQQYGVRVTHDQEAKQADVLERGRTFDALVASGKADAQDRDAYIHGKYAGPSVARKVSSTLDDITKAPSPDQVPSRIAINAGAVKDKLPIEYGPMTGTQPSVKTRTDFDAGDQGQPPPLASTPMGPISNELNTIMAGRDAKLRGFLPREGDALKGMQGTGANAQPVRVPQKYNPDTGGFEAMAAMPDGPTAGQEGAFKGTSEAATESLTRPGAVARSAETAAGDAAARMPFEKEMAQFRTGLDTATPQEYTTHDPDTGREQPNLLNRKTGVLTPVQLPTGQAGGRERPIQATEADQIAGSNAAELVGVQVLRQLRDSGLDQSNDPLDPRWNKFLVNTLKIAPADLAAGDLQQRVAYVNARLTRALTGARPSQYVAIMLQAHLPKQEMSGQQLANVLKDVLEEVSTGRTQLAHTLGVPETRIAPTGGMSYAQYLRTLGTDATGRTPQLTIDANGKLVPIGGAR